MARLPRLLVADLPHLLSQRAQYGQAMARDDDDRAVLLRLLREAAALEKVALHAYSVQGDRIELVATAGEAAALSRLMQTVTRRHAAAYNRRHGRRGSLWEGRFRAAAVEPGDWLLRCMLHVDQLGAAGGGGDPRWSSLAVHVGNARDAALIAPAAYWLLGNTPFEREAAYRDRAERPLPMAETTAIEASLRGGWPLGSLAFAARLHTPDRPALRRPRGRPRRAPAATT